MKPERKQCREIRHRLQPSPSHVWGAVCFGRMENLLSEDKTHTAYQWQKQEQNLGLLLPVIVPKAIEASGPYAMLSPYLPGMPSLARKETVNSLPRWTG